MVMDNAIVVKPTRIEVRGSEMKKVRDPSAKLRFLVSGDGNLELIRGGHKLR